MKAHKNATKAETEIIAKEPALGGLFDGAVIKDDKVTPPKPTEISQQNKTEEFIENDKKDIEQIIEKETTGKIRSNELFYEVFPNNPTENPTRQFAPSIGGILKCVAIQGNLEVVGHPFAEHTAPKFIYTVTVKDTVKGTSVYGQGQANKMDNGIVNPYAQAIALTVAMRNGYEKLILPEIKKQVLDEWYISKFGQEHDMSSILIVGEEALDNPQKYVNG